MLIGQEGRLKKVFTGLGIALGVLILLSVILLLLSTSGAFRYDKHLPTPQPTKQLFPGQDYGLNAGASLHALPAGQGKDTILLMDRGANQVEDPDAKIIAEIPDGTPVTLLETSYSWCRVKGTLSADSSGQNAAKDFEGWLECDYLQDHP